MFCWPSRRGSSSSSRKKSQSSDLSSTGGGDDRSITGGSVGGSSGGGSGGILVKPYKSRKKGKKCSATFKCDLSEALLPPSDECLISLRSASCNSSIRELNGYHQQKRGNSNKQFVSSQINHGGGFGEDSDSVNNNNSKNTSSTNGNNRSAEVLLFYSNNSLSTRNSVADFIDNEEFNYKSLWGKDITEWDSRESRCNTLERDSSIKTGKATTGNAGTSPNCQKEKRLSSAASSPSLTVSSCSQKNKENNKFHQNSKYFADPDDEPLPSPPPTPPEAKICLSTNTPLGSCSYFKYPQSSTPVEKSIQPVHNKVSATPFRIHSSTSTTSLSSSCILTPEIEERSSSIGDEAKPAAESQIKSESCTQTLPFWQLEFPGILYCASCRNRSSHDSGIVLNNSSEGGVIVQHQEDGSATPLLILATRGHESPGGDSSSGISSSDDNLESLHTPDEEIMLKSLKNSFLHQAIPFQLCNFSINSGSNSNKDKSSHGSVGGSAGNGVITSVCASSTGYPSQQQHPQLCQTIVTNDEFAADSNNKLYEQNLKNGQVCHLVQQQQSCHNETDKCELSTEDIPSVTNHQDRNRLGPVGKNYGSSALDANANESEAPILRGQAIGELDPSAKSCTKVSGTTEPLLADPSANNNTSNHLIISKNKSSAHNNRVSSHNQHNAQNSVLVQENSSLKEEVSRLSSVVSDLQEQISRLTTSGEETKKTLEGCVAEADTRCLAFSIVTQQFDQKRTKLEEQLAKQQAENEEWKQRLEEKLAELQKLQLAYEKEKEEHIEEFVKVTSRHELEIDVTVKNCENKLVQLQKRHDETLAELKRSHNEELERLQEAQRQELEQTIQKHRELLDQHRNQSPHDILHKEVESLQVVVEMRNEEIRVLRKDLMDYKNTLNDLQVAREHGKSLLAKIEDLEAQLEKGRADKRDLQERYQRLETNLQQAESENSRLVRCNEELKWKMKSCDIVED